MSWEEAWVAWWCKERWLDGVLLGRGIAIWLLVCFFWPLLVRRCEGDERWIKDGEGYEEECGIFKRVACERLLSPCIA